jgi:alpha-maltose-1-phosphate synthase
MLILSHPTGNENVREATRSLDDAGLLSEFWTSVSWRPEHFLNSLLPNSLRKELNRRSFPHLRREQVVCRPWPEAGRLLARRFGIASLLRHEVGRFSVDAVYRSLDEEVAARLLRPLDVNAVYAYEDGALATFRAARRLNKKAIYELPIGYWKLGRELMEEEAALQPEWAMTLPGKIDSPQKLCRKDEELALATHIVVPSNYVRRSLSKAGHLKATVSVVPYGAPEVSAERRRSTSPNNKLRVVFIGALTQRKGLSYLLRAVQGMESSITLTLVGRRVGQCKLLDAALRSHRWIPSLSHAEVLEELRHQDVMVFPSLFEGFALVILEAMASGVPVITTSHGGAPDFLSDREDGFLVPVRDVNAIAEKLELLAADRERLAAMSHAAMRKAALHSWRQYRQHLASTVQTILTEDGSAESYVGDLRHANT